ncbi:beta strand repeat-containing protein [Stagnihabitans tardus]|uniref:Filamentous hemagglutinin N-terminal domain-containing protein n=1 Tax=Stagnihabitans tardus TaxID=2699202 RepID=A0AAE4Y9K1_9RHOB|nr:YDG domain-containing protein [Stagnihabitans tardus]NBZ86249.1 filamentous hemagglutinin N-terminal domain-containing protein [Stagnihabitans tardus]
MARARVYPGFRLSVMAMLLLGSAWPARAQELPRDPVIVAGDITVQVAPGRMEVGQGSQFGIIDWGAFGIGSGAGVHFANGSGATLNRVTGGEASAILGGLSATGSVYLVNPAGVVVGASGVVDTGGRFVASSLDVTNEDFLNGGDLSFDGAGGVVMNLGRVGSSGGDVVLIAGDVVNDGTLTAPNGTVGLAAGRQVLLRDAAVDEGLISVLVGAGDVTDRGAIASAAAELRAKGGNVYALAGNTDAVIAATGVEKVKGRVFLTAGGGKVVAQKKVTAQDTSGGKITLTGDDIDLASSLQAGAGGTVIVKAQDETTFSGMIQTGPEGFVELSGGHIAYDGSIDTQGGTVLIDPRNIEIAEANASPSLSDATLLSTSDVLALLSTGNLILDTTTLATAASGTIAVTASMTYSSANSLTLLAGGDVWILGNLQNGGTGDVTAVAGWDGATAFDAGAFDAADLTTTTLFGQSNGLTYNLNGGSFAASGTVHVGQGGFTSSTSFGSRDGATRVYGSDIDITGGTSAFSFSSNPYAQLGYHLTGGGDQGSVSGAITARATGSVWVQAGSGTNAYALIGHGGNELAGDVATPTANLSGAITVEAGEDLTMAGSSSNGTDSAYAMIGHGSQDFTFMLQGGRTGAITLDIGGELSIQDGGNFTNSAWIGHETGSGTVSGSVTVTAARMDEDAASAVSGQSSTDVGRWADLTHDGEVRLTLTDSDLLLTGDTSFIDTEGLSITSASDLILQTSGALTLDTGFFYGNDGTGGLVLAASSVDNQAGDGAFLDIGGGRYIFSTRPDQDAGLLGDVAFDGLVYGTTYDPTDPKGGQQALGNVIYYSVTPVATTSDAVMTYGDLTMPVTSTLVVEGVEVDAATFGLSIQPRTDSSLTFSNTGYINAGTYLQSLFTEVTATAATQVLGLDETFGDLTVNRALLTVSLADQSKGYDGVGLYDGVVSYTGFIDSREDASLITTGPSFTYLGGDGSGVNAGAYTVLASGAVISGGNYDFDYTDSATLVIDPKVLTVSFLGPFTKTYDGTTDVTLTEGDFVVAGLVGGQTITISQTQGSHNTASAGETTVTADLSDTALWSITGGSLLNYSIPTLVSGEGQIDRATLVVSIIGTPTKPYDGTRDAVLTPGDYFISGLVAGESITILQTAGTYLTAEPGSQSVVATLADADYQGDGETDLGNYTLDPAATGVGLIVAETPASPIEPTPVAFTAGTETEAEPEPPLLNGSIEVIQTETTGRILEEIQSGTNFCREFVDPQYAIDCLSDRLQSVADGLSATGEYSEVRAALEDAASDLHALAVQNASAALSRSVGRASDGSGQTTGRPLTAVDEALLAGANAQAAAIIANTQLVLLRSAANSDRRRVAFEQVGEVLGSTVVLLRS